MNEGVDGQLDAAVAELLGAIIDILPPPLQREARRAIIPALAQGWSPPAANVERVVRLATELGVRRKSSAALGRVSQSRADAARAQRPALMAIKRDIHSRNPRLSERALNKRTAETASRLLGRLVSESQVRRATADLKKET